MAQTFTPTHVKLTSTLLLALLTGCALPQAQCDDAVLRGQDLLHKQRVLALVAHPDDLEWFIGGTLRRLADNGAQVDVIVASDGERGPNRHNVSDLPNVRRQEQLAAARINRYSEVHFLGLPDRGVAQNPRLIPEVTEIFRAVQPDAVLLFDPEFPTLPYLHPDHQGSARAFLKFWTTLPEGQRPGVYLFQTSHADVAVDISSVENRKAEAIAQHRSQGFADRTSQGKPLSNSGARFGLRSAEGFRLLR